jgi:hypothetical protein
MIIAESTLKYSNHWDAVTCKLTCDVTLDATYLIRNGYDRCVFGLKRERHYLQIQKFVWTNEHIDERDMSFRQHRVWLFQQIYSRREMFPPMINKHDDGNPTSPEIVDQIAFMRYPKLAASSVKQRIVCLA